MKNQLLSYFDENFYPITSAYGRSYSTQQITDYYTFVKGMRRD